VYWVMTCETEGLCEPHGVRETQRVSNSPGLDGGEWVDVFPFALREPQGGERPTRRYSIHRTLRYGSRLARSTAPLSWGSAVQDEEPNAPLLTGILKDGGEFTASIGLNGSDGHRHPPLEGRDELGGRHPHGAAVGSPPHPSRR